jgi:polyphosphate kinase
MKLMSVNIQTLQIELLKWQHFVREQKTQHIIVFEGRDAAGKSGAIKRFMEHLNPRYARVVALDKPTEQESAEWYWQRYIRQFPQAGQITFFDRSWYNRAGVESVMGFCTSSELKHFYKECPILEKVFIDAGINITKFWFDITQEEQNKRFNSRQTHPLKVGKMSVVDIASQDKWNAYTDAYNKMIAHTSISESPWIWVDSNNKQKARIAAMQYLLLNTDYLGKDIKAIGEIDSNIIKNEVK